ncbi:hypothetical protein [Pseudonocardia alni]|uniref:hypothetical protein n=1 Tax=Pseudonocardia alni TaxID=33907 RepID=UPI00331BB61F
MLDHDRHPTTRITDPFDYPTFSEPHLRRWLEDHEIREFDLLDFGMITTGRDDRVIGYNRYEAGRAGLR